MSDFRGLAKLNLPPEVVFHIRSAVNHVWLVSTVINTPEAAAAFQQLVSQPIREMEKRLEPPPDPVQPRRHHPQCPVVTETPSGRCTCTFAIHVIEFEVEHIPASD